MGEKADIAVVGGGPGGYVAALRASQLNKKVVLIEKERIGGTCMNWGCIPAKFLLQQSRSLQELQRNKNLVGPVESIRCDWKSVQVEKAAVVSRLVSGIELLLKKNKVHVVRGTAEVTADKRIRVGGLDQTFVVDAETVILATGGRPADLPFIQPDGRLVCTSREVLDWQDVPETLLVIGAGAIGLELGLVYQRLGSRVVVLEIMPQILPGSDSALAKRLQRILERQGLEIHTRMKIEDCARENPGVTLAGTCLRDESAFAFTGDKVLLAAGRRPNSEELAESLSGLTRDGANHVIVNDYLETPIPGIYAIGDLIGGRLLAHKASHEGITAVENSAGAERICDRSALPLAVYTEPEFASVGMTEAEARERSHPVKIGSFSLQANGRALTMGEPEGMVKIIADKEDRILGAHILAPHASELIAEMTLAITHKLTLGDVAAAIHVHPTLSESLMEAALKADNRSLHALNL